MFKLARRSSVKKFINIETLLEIIGSTILFALMFLLIFLALAVGNSTPTY